ncbi:hypothetical protein CRUP_014911, partial [Coryphaenoides rupestris]
MMDTAMKDYTEGGLINFEKRRKEFEVIAQIKLLQLASNNYSFTPDGHFRDWFSSVERLSEAERPYQGSGGGGGDSGDALSVTSVSSSGSDLEDVNASFLSDSPEGHERKARQLAQR